MKQILIVFLALTSTSAFAEVSASKCALHYNYDQDKWVLTNEIKKDNYVIDSNCLDLVKGASVTTVDGKVKGVILNYTNP